MRPRIQVLPEVEGRGGREGGERPSVGESESEERDVTSIFRPYRASI